MSEQRALRMQLGNAASLGRLRRRSGIEVCEHEDALWLRVKQITDELDADLRTLPGTRFAVLPDRQLVRFGSLVPKGHLPDDQWIDLAQWMTVRTDSSALSGQVNDRIGLQLVRGGAAGDSNVIVTTVDAWREYAASAPQIRLDRWAFAINGDSQAVVRGTPLPPVKGVRFIERSGIAVESGWMWTPAVAADVVRSTLGLEQDDLALLHADETWDLIRADDFVRATRSSVRLSVEGLADG